MPPDSKTDSPQVAQLKANRANLVEKQKFLDTQEDNPAHDIQGSKNRTQAGIREIDAELKRLAK